MKNLERIKWSTSDGYGFKCLSVAQQVCGSRWHVYTKSQGGWEGYVKPSELEAMRQKQAEHDSDALVWDGKTFVPFKEA